jgi:uncharacterized protein YuzE
MMKTHFDPLADVLYVRVSEKRIDHTQTVAPGVNLDIDAGGDLVGIEVLSVSTRVKTEGPEKVGIELLLGEPR